MGLMVRIGPRFRSLYSSASVTGAGIVDCQDDLQVEGRKKATGGRMHGLEEWRIECDGGDEGYED